MAEVRNLFFKKQDGSIRIWNYNTGKILHELIKEDKTEVTAIEVSRL